MLNWIKSIFMPTPVAPPKKPKSGWKQKGHYRKYKNGKKVWVGPKQ